LTAPHLASNMHILEVGCGNGFVTEFLSEKLDRVDAFDQSEEMISMAIKRLASKNNCRLFIKELPQPSHDGLELLYDAILSARVLINLPNHDAQ